MAGGIDWFRWHHGSVTDPKFQLVARKSKQSLATVIAVWAFVLEKASASEERGHFGGLDCESVDCMFGLDDGATQAILSAMADRGLVDADRVASWEKRQVKRERTDDVSTDRVKAFRSKERQETPKTNDETPCNAMERQETPREEKRREEVIDTAPSPKSPRGTALPADWTLPDDWKAWAVKERPDVDPITAADSFRDFWIAKPGKEGRKADWQATWRNWVRNQRAQSYRPAVPAGDIWAGAVN